ncbi:MAG: NAD(P)-dependent oxidoreductase [Caulobacteraceae bacterium]
MNVFPAAFPLRSRRIVIAGDGDAAEAKARLFDGSPAEVLRLRGADAFDADRYIGAALAFIALHGEDAVRAASTARTAGALVNVIDHPELCDFTTPALVDRGEVVGAIMTGGAAPVLATELRLALEAQWPPSLGQIATLLGRVKEQVRSGLPDPSARRALLRALIRGPAGQAALNGRMAEAEAFALAALAESRPLPARIVLLRAPEAPDLLTLRALRWLSEADRILVDAETDPALAKFARRDAPLTVLSADQSQTFASDLERLRQWLGGGSLLVRICATDPRPQTAALRKAGFAVEIG